jgi:hypothetical protein
MGYGAIRGSSSSGGRAAYLQAKEHSKAGISVVFAVDGPRGPKYKAKPGALRLSNELNKPILMFSVSVSRSWILSSWDGFMIPKPFAKIAIIADAPFWATSESDEIDYFSQRLRELSSLTAK